jgi:selenide,water dikinase
VASRAGAAVLGGHSITDPEPKYGMAALGLADPDLIVRNSTAPAGARLFLTKPLGLGIASTALKRGVADPELVARAVDVMTTLNDDASVAMVEAGAEAATDVTGFGLLGHLHRMLLASGVAATVDAGAVPLLPGTLDLARADVVPGGTKRNHAHVAPHTDWPGLATAEQLVLADAQTSGGLLVAATDGDRLAAELSARAVPFAEIGHVEEGDPGRVTVLGRLEDDASTGE